MEEEEKGKEDGDFRGASALSAYVNLFNCAVGAGILALPHAFANIGLALAVILFFIMAGAAHYSLNLLVNASTVTQEKSYDSLVLRVFEGPAFVSVRVVYKVIVILYTFGVCVGYIIIIGDLLPELLREWAGYSLEEARPFVLSPQFIQMLAAVFLLAPLSALPRIDQLKYASAFALFAALFFTFVVILKAAEYFNSDEYTSPTIVYFNLSPSLFRGIPIIAFALGGHVQCISIYNELRDSDRTQRKFLYISSAMVLSLTVVYLNVAILSYLRFLPNDSNILKAMLIDSPGDPLIQTSSLMMTAVVVFSYPLLSFPMRLAIEELICGEARPSRTLRIVVTVLILATTFLVAILVKNIDIVFGITGATGATILKYILPGVLHLRLHFLQMQCLSIAQMVPACLLVVSGIIIGFLGVLFIILDAV